MDTRLPFLRLNVLVCTEHAEIDFCSIGSDHVEESSNQSARRCVKQPDKFPHVVGSKLSCVFNCVCQKYGAHSLSPQDVVRSQVSFEQQFLL